MSNISQKKRAAMLAYLAELKQVHNDDESIRALNEIEAALTEKKYGLVWEEHTEQVDQMLEDNIPVFIEDEARKIVADPDQPFNFLIEGDNLHSLKLLEKTHKGKIDVIYIDPPYNTKNKEFIYDDCMIGEDDGYRHSKWLSFMEKRLMIARDLLKSTGVIFISIDDNEQAQLKLLCDEIFGEGNCLGPIIQNKLNAKNDTLNIQKNHEFILVYRKEEIQRNGKTVATILHERIKERRVFSQGEEYFYLSDQLTTRGEGGTLYARPNLGYTIYYNPETEDFIGVQDYNTEEVTAFISEDELYKDDVSLVSTGYVKIRPPLVRGQLGAWTWELSRFNENRDMIFLKETSSGYSVHRKILVPKDDVVKVKGKLIYGQKIDGNSKSIVEFSTNDGTKELKKVLGVSSFNNPKNLNMIQYLIKMMRGTSITVLDFFAGSGTTGQAVAALNMDDDVERRYILCTNNENNICEEVTYKRLTNIQGELPHNLKYYKTDFIPKLSSEEDILSDRLLSHIKEMVELENMCEIDGVNRFIFLREPDLQAWYEQGVDEDVTIYIPSYILLSREVENELEAKEVKVVHIPDYYFLNELREANEL